MQPLKLFTLILCRIHVTKDHLKLLSLLYGTLKDAQAPHIEEILGEEPEGGYTFTTFTRHLYKVYNFLVSTLFSTLTLSSCQFYFTASIHDFTHRQGFFS